MKVGVFSMMKNYGSPLELMVMDSVVCHSIKLIGSCEMNFSSSLFFYV
jgi:hypothetical protein